MAALPRSWPAVTTMLYRTTTDVLWSKKQFKEKKLISVGSEHNEYYNINDQVSLSWKIQFNPMTLYPVSRRRIIHPIS